MGEYTWSTVKALADLPVKLWGVAKAAVGIEERADDSPMSVVGASRFAAEVMLDLLSGRDTELTRLQMVRRKPAPFPPDPLAWAGIEITKREMARADRRGGRKGLWLKFTEALGMGFDS